MKEFTCVCGSKKFYMVQTCETLVDFSKEGAIEGHPFLGGTASYFTHIICAECKTPVPKSIEKAMRKEII